jgi:thioredoxin reductase (NADPH)
MRADEVFPRLTSDQVARLSPVGKERSIASGGLVWDDGHPRAAFAVVLDGAIEVLRPTVFGDQIVTVHEPGSFTGDVDLLAGRATMMRYRARVASRILEIDHRQLRAVVQVDDELGGILLSAFILRRSVTIARGLGDVAIVGSRFSAQTLRIQEFLSRNGRPYTLIDVDQDPRIQELLDQFHLRVDDVPVVICRGERVLIKPSIDELASCLGLSRIRTDAVPDLLIIGAGPAGLASAVYGASEGLSVLVFEQHAPGGQAGSSSKIENYLGFPTGVSGQDLAGRAFVQAEKFGADIVIARAAHGLACGKQLHRVAVSPGHSIEARAVVIASGATYRKLDVPGIDRFEGVGVYFGATHLEGSMCRGEEVIVVGGGNSAGQAAVFLSHLARRVHLLVRGPGLAATMSRYLVRRIEETPSIDLRTQTNLVRVEGDDHLERVTWRDGVGREVELPIRHVFVMTGAEPNTRWLENCVRLDDRGFIKTGTDLDAGDLQWAEWPLARPPLPFETSVPHIFAVGDARANSVKRVAAAVGEGAACVPFVHRALAE